MSSFFQSPPEGWKRCPLKFMAENPKNGAWGEEAGQGEVDAICVRVADFNWERLSLDLSNPTIRSFKESQIEKLSLQTDDIVLEKSGGGEKTPVGRVVRFEGSDRAVTSNFVARVRPTKSTDSGFLLYMLAAQYMSRFSIQFVKQNTGIQNLDDTSLFRSDVWVPDLPTQKRIAAFLDRSTARIDELIAKKERLVDLIHERGAAAREELLRGDGPISKLGHHISILPGYAFASANFSDNPEDIRLLRGANVGVDEICWDDTVYWPAADAKGIERFRLEAGDLVMGMDRPWISGGIRVSEITEADLPCLLLQRVCKISPRKTLEAQYLKAMIESKRFVAYFEPILTGVSVPHISGDQIANFRFPFISVDEQVRRMDELGKITRSIQPVSQATLTSIDRLREYRAALITAAVTGQLDVDSYDKTGSTSATLDQIEEEMQA
nr:restriction endonuclease subunit S [uncultured Cohaesibacter sp.]